MELPPLQVTLYQQSKKRVFPGSSSSYVDPDVVEIPPPVTWSTKPKSLKQKEVIHHEVIDIDMDEDSGDVMLIDEKVNTHNKGKEILANPSYCESNKAKPGSADGVGSSKKSSAPGGPGLLHSFNLEGFSNDFTYGDDEYMDIYHDDLTYDDEYAFLQAHFDSIDIPPGVEAPIPWFSDPSQSKKDVDNISSSNQSSFSLQLDTPGTGSYDSWGLKEIVQMGKPTSMSSSSLETLMDSPSHPYGLDLSSSRSFPKSARNKKKSTASIGSTYVNSQTERVAKNHPSGFKSGSLLGFPHGKKKIAVSSSTTNHTSHNQLDAMKLSSGMDPSLRKFYLRNGRKKQVGNGSLTHSRFSMMDTMNAPPGADSYMPGWQGSPISMNKLSLMSDGIHNSSDAVHLFSEKEINVAWVKDAADSQTTAAGSSTAPFGSTSRIEEHGNENDILNKFQLFKQFDMVQDHSDHHYSGKASTVKQPSKTWAKKIQDEWRILEKDLPDTIFVRVYESRMDLLRAVIVGAEGTPYHDGLFFFDVFFPCGYPNVPPLVYYHSGGLRINPNLYNCGKVCLSLLNTWSGSQNEKWIPGVSTMLQVLVSIQALILNSKPYFNEPGYARMNGSASGEKNSEQYNENTFILSLKTMVYSMRRPPKHFEDFVVGHFFKHAQDILVACKAYMDGAQVGCLAKGGVQDVDAGDKSCSQYLKDSLASYITVLVQTFSQIGAKDCEKFLPLAEKGNSRKSLPLPIPMQMHMPMPLPMGMPMPMPMPMPLANASYYLSQ